MNIRYICNFGKPTGYARAAEDYLTAFARMGVDFAIEPILDIDANLLGPRAAALLPHVVGWSKAETELAPPTHVVIHAQPHVCLDIAVGVRLNFPGVPIIAYTTWETWPAPYELCESLEDSFDLVLVPSDFCKRTLVKGKFPRARCEVVPHCFDPEAWRPTAKRNDKDVCTFVSVLSWNARKNPFGLLRAYLTEFEVHEPVVLRLLVPWHIERDIEVLKIGAQLEDYPAVDIENSVSDAGYEAFLRSGDCYVTASRGEGWDLPLFDAVTATIPVIAHQFGGARDYLTAYPGWREYGFQMTPTILPITDRGSGARLLGPEFVTGRQAWAEPDLAALRTKMRGFYDEWHGGTERELPFNPRVILESAFSYGTVGQRYVRILGDFTMERKES